MIPECTMAFRSASQSYRSGYICTMATSVPVRRADTTACSMDDVADIIISATCSNFLLFLRKSDGLGEFGYRSLPGHDFTVPSRFCRRKRETTRKHHQHRIRVFGNVNLYTSLSSGFGQAAVESEAGQRPAGAHAASWHWSQLYPAILFAVGNRDL